MKKRRTERSEMRQKYCSTKEWIGEKASNRMYIKLRREQLSSREKVVKQR